MTFPDQIILKYEIENPSISGDDSDQLPESFVRWILGEYSEEGQKIFDPFFGLGGAVFTAEEMDMIPYGIEADRERFEWVAGQAEHWLNLRCADSIDVEELGFPKMDLLITSPPFMAKNHKWNPLYGGDPDFAGYDLYLERMTEIFAEIKTVMKRGSLLAIHVENINGRVFTPLVRDMSVAISQSFKPVGETIVQWEGREVDTPSHCLFFKN